MRADHWADIGFGIHAGAKPQPTRILDDALDETRGDALVDVDTLGGGADLPGVEQRGPGHTGYGDLQVGVFGDDEGVFATQFQVQLFDLVGGDAGDAPARLQAAGEGDHPHTRIEHQRLARRLAP